MGGRRFRGVRPASLRTPAARLGLLPGRLTVGRPRSPIGRFLLAAIAAVAVLALVYVAFVLTEVGQWLENLALAGAAFRDPAEIEGSLAGLSGISILSYGVAIAGVFATAMFRRRHGLALASASVMAASIVIAEVLKDVLPRPQLVDAPRWLLSNSFPSGHATIAVSIGVGALLVAPGRLRWLVLPVAAVYAATIAQAVQIAGWHRLSGTLGSGLLVLAVACVALAALGTRGYVVPSSDGRVHPYVYRGLVLGAGVMVGLALLIALLAVLFPALLGPTGADRAFAHTAFDLVGVGLTVVMLVVFARIIEPYSLGRADRVSPPSGDEGSETHLGG